MTQETPEQFDERRSSNRLNRIMDATNEAELRERISTHLEAEAIHALIVMKNRITAKRMGLI